MCALKKGMFIALYGINNIGKSTQVKRLKDQFELMGKSVKSLKYPLYDLPPTGPKINYFLRDPEAEKITGESFQMLYIQNRLDYQDQLLRDLETHDVVLAEDYIGTGMAWGMTQGVPYEWLRAKNRESPQKKPDQEMLLDGDRFLEGKEVFHRNEDDAEAVNQTRKNFLFLAKRYHWPVINANQSPEKVTAEIWKCIIASSLPY